MLSLVYISFLPHVFPLFCAAFTLVTPTNSPRIGARSSQVVAVGLAAASGPIGFAASSLVAQGQVPVTGLYPVPLQVVRSGTYGQATVSWVIAIANPNSVSSTAGTVVIQDGKLLDVWLRHFFQ